MDENKNSAERALSLSVRNLYKIFGPESQKYLQAVRDGMSKKDLLSLHGHVLGLRDICLDIPAGSIQIVMGLSGSGKSTLIRHINRLIEPSSGAIVLHQQGHEVNVLDLSARALRQYRRRQTAMVFQKFALLPHLTVRENIEFGLSIQGLSSLERGKRSQYWISRVGLEGYDESYPNQLSGGMQQRVGLARALAIDAPILLMDEAFSALDPMIRGEMQGLLLELQQDIGKTIIFITHDLDEALRLGDQIAILRDGEVVQQGSAQQIVMHPADDYIGNFVKDVNRGRVLRCRSLMTSGPAVDGPSVDAGLLIEEAARLLSSENRDTANVVGPHGKHLGVLSLSDVIAAMVPPISGGGSTRTH